MNKIYKQAWGEKDGKRLEFIYLWKDDLKYDFDHLGTHIPDDLIVFSVCTNGMEATKIKKLAGHMKEIVRIMNR